MDVDGERTVGRHPHHVQASFEKSSSVRTYVQVAVQGRATDIEGVRMGKMGVLEGIWKSGRLTPDEGSQIGTLHEPTLGVLVQLCCEAHPPHTPPPKAPLSEPQGNERTMERVCASVCER